MSSTQANIVTTRLGPSMLSPILSPSLALDDIELLLAFKTGSDELMPGLLRAYLLGLLSPNTGSYTSS